MKIKELYNKDEEITIETYLNKHGIKDIQEYLYPTGKYLESPQCYNNMNTAISVILDSISKNYKIGILADIDGDGWYSSSLCYKYLKLLDSKIDIQVFFHKSKVHGLSEEGLIDNIIKSKIQLMIIPDASSADEKFHKILYDNKIRITIFDHHPTEIHSKYAIVVNNQQSPSVLNKSGSGALVMFKGLKEIDDRLNLRYTKNLIDLVYFSLLSDIMNMNTMENVCFSYWAKKNINNKCLIALIDKLANNKPLTNEVISWDIQPKISAIIRSKNQELKETLFWALTNEDEEDINIILKECKKVHEQQKKEVNEYYESCEKIIEDVGIIFQPINIYSFYTGLVASKYVDEYNKPVILYCKNKDNELYTGSVRSNCNVKQLLKNSELFEFVEGHDSACGCGFKKENLEKIKEFCKNVKINDERLVTKSFVTSKIPSNLFNFSNKYNYLWGHNIEKPQFHIYSIYINGKDIKELGNGSTIKFNYKGIDFIKFFCSKNFKEENFIGKNKKLQIEVIGELSQNAWRNKITNQVLIDKIEIKESKLKESDVF